MSDSISSRGLIILIILPNIGWPIFIYTGRFRFARTDFANGLVYLRAESKTHFKLNNCDFQTPACRFTYICDTPGGGISEIGRHDKMEVLMDGQIVARFVWFCVKSNIWRDSCQSVAHVRMVPHWQNVKLISVSTGTGVWIILKVCTDKPETSCIHVKRVGANQGPRG